MTIRKNFVLDEAIAKHLETLAKEQGTTQTAIVSNLIEEQMRERLIQEKLEALERFTGSATGLLEGMTIQSIKEEMAHRDD